MAVSFDRPVGAPADLAELEYVAALHQSQPGDLRPEASVKDVDVVHFLKSRYGIEVDLNTVRNSVLTGLGGGFDDGNSNTGNGGRNRGTQEENGESAENGDGGEEDDGEEEVIDLAELASILLIPTLLQSARQERENAGSSGGDGNSSKEKKLTRTDFDTDGEYISYRKRRMLEKSLRPPGGLVGHVLSMILSDVTGSAETPKRATPALIRGILVAYGEEELSRDDGLVEEMVAALGGGKGGGDGGEGDGRGEALLDVKSFARALTSDVSLYDIGNLARETSNYHDVLSATTERHFEDEAGASSAAGLSSDGRASGVDPPPEQAAAEERIDDENAHIATEAKRTFSAGGIDYVADTYRSKLLVVLLWTGFVLTYVSYFARIDRVIGEAAANNQMMYCDSYYPLEAKIQCYEELYAQASNTKGYIADIDCSYGDGQMDLGCLISKSLVNWLYILAMLMALGLAYVGLGSIGNSVLAKKKWPIIFGIISVGVMSYGFFAIFYQTHDQSYDLGYSEKVYNETTGEYELLFEIESGTTETKSLEYDALVYILALVISSLAMLLQLFLLVGPLVKRCFKSEGSVVGSFFTPGSVTAEAQLKRAAARKLNGMVVNARDMHGEAGAGGNGGAGAGGGDAHFGQALINFSLQGDRFEPAGGFLWTWKRVFSGALFEEEGVWISSRIWAGNFAQFLIMFFILTWGLVTTREVVQQWREGLLGETNLVLDVLGWFGIDIDSEVMAAEATDHVSAMLMNFTALNFDDDYTCIDTISDAIADMGGDVSGLEASQLCLVLEHAVSQGLFNVSQIAENVTESAAQAVKSATDEVSNSIYPQEEIMIKAPLLLATSVAFVSCFMLVIIYIPSVTATTLRFRSGAIPYLHDRKHAVDYRSQMDTILTVLGSMFWGAIYSAGFLGIIFGGILFLFLWQATQQFMVQVFALLVGLIITAVIRILLILVFLRATVFTGFYRKRPAQGNIVSLILECANIGYGVGTALARAVKLVLISALYIGRMDTPLLANGVGVGPLRDLYPIIFRKEILAHEAHRHPYLEVLGTMYLMKIRYGDNFGNRAGYTFRLIFTVALMPWVRKYRVLARPSLLEEEDKGKGMDAENFDSSLLLPKSSVLRSSVMAMSMIGKSTVGGPAASPAPEKEIRRLQEQVIMRDAEIEERDRELDAKDEEIKRLHEALRNAASVTKDPSIEAQMT